MNDKSQSYWNDYYQQHKISFPSQFAAFCLNEVPNNYTIIDCGCGDGRDSLFFARYGRKVIGLDRSTEAIELCKSRASNNKLPTASFSTIDFENNTNVDSVIKNLSPKLENVAIYARFFIHAINEIAEAEFLRFTKSLCENHNGVVFFEFRTPEDAAIDKNFGQHYRRYVDLGDISSKMKSLGFHLEYSTSGKGLAKYKSEDAHVARIVAKLSK